MIASNRSLASKPQTPLWLGPIPVPVMEQGHSAVPCAGHPGLGGWPCCPSSSGGCVWEGRWAAGDAELQQACALQRFALVLPGAWGGRGMLYLHHGVSVVVIKQRLEAACWLNIF